MSDVRQQWFKIWAAEALLSDDLDDLSDHEERIWWRLVMVASLEESRWFFQISDKTARKCHTKVPKLTAAVENFLGRGMLTKVESGWYFVTNGPKWNEDTERKRKPSDSPDRVLERVTRHRNAQRNAALQGNGNAAHKEEEKEEEEEKEKERNAAGAARPRRRAIKPEDVARWEGQHPTVDIPAMISDYENWKGSAGHHDKVLGFENQLRDEWRLEKFRKRTPERRYNREEGIFAGVD